MIVVGKGKWRFQKVKSSSKLPFPSVHILVRKTYVSTSISLSQMVGLFCLTPMFSFVSEEVGWFGRI